VADGAYRDPEANLASKLLMSGAVGLLFERQEMAVDPAPNGLR
jgi:hypothetical protein